MRLAVQAADEEERRRPPPLPMPTPAETPVLPPETPVLPPEEVEDDLLCENPFLKFAFVPREGARARSLW